MKVVAQHSTVNTLTSPGCQGLNPVRIARQLRCLRRQLSDKALTWAVCPLVDTYVDMGMTSAGYRVHIKALLGSWCSYRQGLERVLKTYAPIDMGMTGVCPRVEALSEDLSSV